MSTPLLLADLPWPRRTARLVLRPARPEDAAAIWPWHRDPDVQRWTTTLCRTFEEHEAWWERCRSDVLVAALADGAPLVDGAHVAGSGPGGGIVATGMVRRNDAWGQSDVVDRARGRQAELGWVLDPRVQGRGLGTELAGALLDIAVDGLGVRRVTAECFADNLASRRVMERIGLRLEAHHHRDSLHRDGTWRDGMVYALLAEEHRARGGHPAGDGATPPTPTPVPAPPHPTPQEDPR